MSSQLKSLSKGLQVYKEICFHGKPILATTLCKKLSLNKSTISRILQTLEEEGYIRYLENTNEIIANNINESSNKTTRLELICNKTKALLEEVNKISSESAYLGVFDNYKVLYLNQINNPNSSMQNSIGLEAPLHTNALGKSLLAFGNYNLNNLKLNSYTFNTITNVKNLQQNLEDIRNIGYSIDDKEHQDTMRCVATPLFNNENILIGAIAISGDKKNLSLEKSHKLGKIISKLSSEYSILC